MENLINRSGSQHFAEEYFLNSTFKIKIILGKKVFLTDSITSVITLSGETWQTFTAHSSKWQ